MRKSNEIWSMVIEDRGHRTGNKLVTSKERNSISGILVEEESKRTVEAYVKEVARIQIILILVVRVWIRDFILSVIKCTYKI